MGRTKFDFAYEWGARTRSKPPPVDATRPPSDTCAVFAKRLAAIIRKYTGKDTQPLTIDAWARVFTRTVEDNIVREEQIDAALTAAASYYRKRYFPTIRGAVDVVNKMPTIERFLDIRKDRLEQVHSQQWTRADIEMAECVRKVSMAAKELANDHGFVAALNLTYTKYVDVCRQRTGNPKEDSAKDVLLHSVFQPRDHFVHDYVQHVLTKQTRYPAAINPPNGFMFIDFMRAVVVDLGLRCNVVGEILELNIE